jgi:RimJ/RimL family protein N-acetyltransferase
MPAFAETERLILRPFREADTPRLFALMDDVRIREGEPYPLAPNHPSFAQRIPEMVKGSLAWVRVSLAPHPAPHPH